MGTGGGTILLVEHHQRVRKLMSRTLAAAGYDVIEAGDGLTALALFDESQDSIDLAIIDALMPGMSGLDVAVVIQRHSPACKILYVSSHTGSIAIEGIRRTSPESLLLKPFTAHCLMSRIDA